MRRYIYVGCAFVLAAATGLMVLRSQHTVAVVYATHDVVAGSAIRGEDLEVRKVHDDGAPDGALSTPDAAAGHFAALSLTAGEPVLERAVSTHRSGSGIARQFAMPPGAVAVAVPVQPAGAVGGILQPGDHVDVWATAQPGREPASANAAGASAQLLGRDVLVLELRSDQGQSLQPAKEGSGSNVHGLNFGGGKLGSVVLAIPGGDVQRYAIASSGSTFYLALSVG